jgi:selenocysteine lyase/cysteine desulfurase
MTELYYFDNSATTLKKPAAVAEAVYHAIADGQLGNPARGSHTASLNALRLTETLRQKTAALFGVPDAANVAFTANATASLNMVLKGLLTPADYIITTVTEHNAVLRPLYQLEEQGATLSFVGIDELGTLLYSDLERLLRAETRAVVVNHASNVTGNAVDLERSALFAGSTT